MTGLIAIFPSVLIGCSRLAWFKVTIYFRQWIERLGALD